MITIEDMKSRFGEEELAELTDREHGREIQEDVVDLAIFDALSDVSSYLQAVGLVAWQDEELVYAAGQAPKSLIIRTCDIARYYLYEDGVTEIVEQRYQQAIEWLKMVMKNPAMLDSSRLVSGKAQSGIVVRANVEPKIWI